MNRLFKGESGIVAPRVARNGSLAVGAQKAFNEEAPLNPDGDFIPWLFDPFGRIVYALYTRVF